MVIHALIRMGQGVVLADKLKPDHVYHVMKQHTKTPHQDGSIPKTAAVKVDFSDRLYFSKIF